MHVQNINSKHLQLSTIKIQATQQPGGWKVFGVWNLVFGVYVLIIALTSLMARGEDSHGKSNNSNA
jgi:hypothetical protein